MATSILNPTTSFSDQMNVSAHEVLSEMKKLKETNFPQSRNSKRKNPTSSSNSESAFTSKRLQLNQTDYSQQKVLQHPFSPQVGTNKSGVSSTESERSERMHITKGANRAEDDTIPSFLKFFGLLDNRDKTSALISSLISNKSPNEPLTIKVQEELRLEEAPAVSPKVQTIDLQAKMKRIESNNNLQLKEDSTTFSDNEESVEAETANPETPVKPNTPVQEAEQKIVEIQVGPAYQVSDDYINSLWKAPTKRGPVKAKWIPNEEVLPKFDDFVGKLASTLKIPITNYQKAIKIFGDASNDVDTALKVVIGKKSMYKTQFMAGYNNGHRTLRSRE